MKKLTTQEFIERASKIHNNFYDYSKVNYINARTKVIIICPIHGEFEQLPNNHLSGQICFWCSKKLTSQKRIFSTTEFIERAKLVHGDFYDYSKVIYEHSQKKVIIICPIHGEFTQRQDAHLNGQNCPFCARQKLTQEEWIEKANIKHNFKYDYSLVNYINPETKIIIICPIHGEFEQIPNNHLNGRGCYKCGNEIITKKTSSKAENKIYEFLKQINPDLNILKHNRNILKDNKELDLYLPDYKIAIEFNGLYWHSEKCKKDNYHQEKYKECLNNGIRLIQIFEDEWFDKQEIVKDCLKHILNLTENKIYARKCKILKLKNKDVQDFLDDNHIQGYCDAQIIYGLFCDTGLGEELVSLISFDKQTKDDVYELLRFVSLKDYSVIGGASKLLKHFIKEYKPEEIYSYCDLRWSQGNLYTSLGFEEVSIIKPNYFYVSGLKRLNHLEFNKDILIKDYGCPQEMSEKEFMRDIMRYNRIYDAGTKLFKLKL